jgi:parvulin-like peptidyl-prolyl isomerase
MDGAWIVAAMLSVLVAACGQRREEQAPRADAAVEEEGDRGPCPEVAEADRNKVVAKVGETTITVCDVTEALNKMSPYLRKAYEAPEKRRQFVDNMIRFELIAQEAVRRGYADDEEVQRVEKQMMIQRLNKELQDSVSLDDITEEEMRAYYEEHSSEYHKAEMVRIARILTKTEADCEKVLTLARDKATDSRFFRELAREHSIDEQTKEQGGDMPYFPRAEDRTPEDPEVDPALVEAAFSLEMSDPLYTKCVQSKEGWNVLRLRGRRTARDLAYDDVSRQIRHRLHRDRLAKVRDELVANLRKSAKITVNDEALARINIEAPPEQPQPPEGMGPPAGEGKAPLPGGKAPFFKAPPGVLKAPGAAH